MRDKSGRPYAILSELAPGELVEVDQDFPCMQPWTTQQVHHSDDGLYIHCKDGRHYLHNETDGGEHCVGIYHIKPPKP